MTSGTGWIGERTGPGVPRAAPSSESHRSGGAPHRDPSLAANWPAHELNSCIGKTGQYEFLLLA